MIIIIYNYNWYGARGAAAAVGLRVRGGVG